MNPAPRPSIWKIRFIMLLGAAGGCTALLFFHRCEEVEASYSAHQQGPVVSLMALPGLGKPANPNSDQENSRARPQSVAEWVQWLKEEAHFRYDRNENKRTGEFEADEEAFKKLGLDHEAAYEIYASVSDGSSHVLHLVWQRAPDRLRDDGTQTVCEYEPFRDPQLLQRVEMLKEFRGQFSFNIARALKVSREMPEMVDNLTEAMVQILRAEPILRDFDQGRFTATLRDELVDGKRQYHVTEEALGPSGEVTWKNEFTSDELPPPYAYNMLESP